MRLFFMALALAVSGSSLTAHEFKIADLVVDHPVALATAKTAQTGAGYFVITNTGDTADRLIGVEAEFPRVMVHDTKVENDIATMFHVDAIEIPAGETVTFMPGGKHVMFMGLGGDPFEEGETFEGTLVFENAGRLDITFNVETRETYMADKDAPMVEMDHSTHGN